MTGPRTSPTDATIWAKLAAPVPAHAIQWRQDGRPTRRQDGTFVARFVAYVDAQLVRERLDAVVPGEWDLELALLPALATVGTGENDAPIAFKATLSIFGTTREDVGTGRDYKSASTDAFKRAAVRFGIGHELYSMPQLWVRVDGDGKYAKPLEDPAAAYARKFGGSGPRTGKAASAPSSGNGAARPASAPVPADPYNLASR